MKVCVLMHKYMHTHTHTHTHIYTSVYSKFKPVLALVGSTHHKQSALLKLHEYQNVTFKIQQIICTKKTQKLQMQPKTVYLNSPS